MKAAIFLATHNKNEALGNVLHSITRQKTSFPFEVIICDDASHDIAGLREVVFTHLGSSGIPFRFIILSSNVGSNRSQSFCLDLIGLEVDTIVLQSSDVFYAGDDVLEKLCRNTAPGRFTLAEVRNVSVDPQMWRSFEKNLPFYLENERLMETLAHINADPRQQDRGSYTIHHVFYSGTRQPRPLERWYFFLGAIRKDDLLETCFPTCCADVNVSNDLHRLGKECMYVDAIGIHQRHPV